MVQLRGTNSCGLNLENLIANPSVGLSQQNIEILQEKGLYMIFCPEMNDKLFHRHSLNNESIHEITFTPGKLAPIHVQMIANNVEWIYILKLNFSNNKLGYAGAKIIGSNQSWINLEILNLANTDIGD